MSNERDNKKSKLPKNRKKADDIFELTSSYERDKYKKYSNLFNEQKNWIIEYTERTLLYAISSQCVYQL